MGELLILSIIILGRAAMTGMSHTARIALPDELLEFVAAQLLFLHMPEKWKRV
jgi:hypothetical protein